MSNAFVGTRRTCLFFCNVRLNVFSLIKGGWTDVQIIVSRLRQDLNVSSSISVTELGIVIFDTTFLVEYSLILVTQRETAPPEM